MYRHRTPLQLLQVQEVHVVEGLGAVVAAKKVYPAAFFRGTDGGTWARNGEREQCLKQHSQPEGCPRPTTSHIEEPVVFCLAEGTLPQKKKKKELLGATSAQASLTSAAKGVLLLQ